MRLNSRPSDVNRENCLGTSRALVKTEGFVPVLGYRLFYKSFGEPRRGTILCLHGGPGATHDYLLSMADLSRAGYRVVFYDQLGCGRSDLPKDLALFVIERYVREVEEFRRVMNLGRIHLIGSSFGGQLAIAYALQHQGNLRSLVTVGGYHNVMMVIEEMHRMKEELPADIRRTLTKFEDLGEYQNPEYLHAVTAFYRKHLCRIDTWPAEVQYSLDHTSRPVYETMNGPNEFTIIGNIRYWDVSRELRRLRVPMLILCGKYDEISPTVAKDLHRRVLGSKLVVFEKSSHMPFWEERTEFMRVVNRFVSDRG
jgi:proline iminopeptidase